MSDTQSLNKERHMPSLNRASPNLFSSNIAHQDTLRPEQVLDKLTHLLGASNVQADPEKTNTIEWGGVLAAELHWPFCFRKHCSRFGVA
ncbi:hypothetical protein ACOBWA_06990 [Psychrobacter sp. ER1]|uniref:hypothetical protein n=1 Tax=Psychrobacter sp. ER1 TaxID=3406645 RepID=UPI003B43390F